MKLNKFLFLLMSFIMISATALAQKRVYTGQVVDDQNEPVIGASVIQKGTSTETSPFLWTRAPLWLFPTSDMPHRK